MIPAAALAASASALLLAVVLAMPVPPAPAIVASSSYEYAAPPSIAREQYIAIWCDAGSPACDEAGAMYDALVGVGLDPAIEAAQASHETSLGTAGVGVPPTRNPHGVQCHVGDGRIGDAPVSWGNGCAGMYATYTDAVVTWARLIQREYVAEGLTTPALAVWKYAPVGADGNDPPAYIVAMEAQIDAWRAASTPVNGFMSNPIGVGGDAFGSNVQCALDANGGGLRMVDIPPGAWWSFNAAMGDPSAVCAEYVAGVLGGGWCNLAARYAQVARALGLTVDFIDHGVGDLGGGPENSVAIWNVDGTPGNDGERRDLLIGNPTGRVVRLTVIQTSDHEIAIVGE